MSRFIPLLVLMALTYSVPAQEQLARITVSVASVGFRSTVSFSKGDTVVVFEPAEPASLWAVWTRKGETVFLNKQYFQLIPGKPIFKLKTDTAQLRETACSRHTRENFELISVNYCDLVNRIIRKESAALTDFFGLIPRVNAALAEIHASDTWQVINYFTDDELIAWLSSLRKQEVARILNYLQQEYVAYPITRYEEYLGLYYPKSWNFLQKSN
ncbi:MAG: hypothetical protein U0T82_05915 [Bacteroidales bacterium]